MSNTTLRKGDKGEAVHRLQCLLNRVGAMLMPDSEFGSATVRAVQYAQDAAGQAVTGVAEAALWNWLETKPEPFPPLDTNGVAFIAAEETGGLAYYEQFTRWAHYPGEESGITIGVGYDLRMNTLEDFSSTWGPHLSASEMNELAKDIGKKGTKARTTELRNLGLQVPFKRAWPVFIAKTLPRYYANTASIYPSIETLPGLCRSVLVSLVFNRGTSLKGESRKEMREIQGLLAKASAPGLPKAEAMIVLGEVEDLLVAMKRLWAPTSGLVKRRQSEANLWRQGLARA